ncbi:JNK-interacting protein 3 [Condylostylus longicornis]|uniref:JNK-interacting protein 3 n=1 Tax=Condylostylus longicornis TaxID=2530218 RepID=UPI00244DAA52|nr:JNK-interacting protein 3 [Condylostylus longicornis]
MTENKVWPQPVSETVYGTDDNNMVMSEKVQQLAGSIYQEFERMILRYDEDVVKTLMPLLVNVLESLDNTYRTIQEQEVEVELLREDNEQLVTQYEREKSARKQTEQKLLETEDVAEAENKELSSRLESLESIVRMLELKHKNSLEHANRLEEREGELKKEYSKLHERYTELFKTHVDYMERTKMLMGTHSQISSASDKFEINRTRLHPIARSSGPISYGFTSLENSTMLDTERICSDNESDSDPTSLQNEIDNLERLDDNDSLPPLISPTTQHPPPTTIVPPIESSIVPNFSGSMGKTTTHREQRSANTLYQELSFHDNEESEENEVTGSWVHPGEYATSANDNYFGMGKEVENLILENNELLATKNALNIVKDDLIAKVDELTGEVEILHEKLNSVSQSKNKLQHKVNELEEELKKTKEQIKQQHDSEQENENDIPMAQRKRFTRVEMAMVLMERNQYKERLMELQEAVRLTEILRATKNDEFEIKSKQSAWKYFSSLFKITNRPQHEPSQAGMFRYNVNQGSPSRQSTDGNRFILRASSASTASPGLANALILAKDYNDEGTSQRASARRREQYLQLRAHVQKEDGRLHAYGWSLPVNNKVAHEHQHKHSGGVPVPVPVYCNPLAETSSEMKVYCAAGVNLNGGFKKNGEFFIPDEVFFVTKSAIKSNEIVPSAGINGMDSETQATFCSANSSEESQLSSYVWICTSTYCASTVTVIDANNPANVLDAFPVCQSHLLCIASVPGAMENDYVLLERSEIAKDGESLEKPGDEVDNVGRIVYVKNAIVDGLKNNKNNNNTNNSNNANNTNNNNISEIVIENNTNRDYSQTPEGEDVVRSTDANLEFSKPVNPILRTKGRENEPEMSSVGPTMWMGAQDGMLYVHSAIGRWHECLHKVELPDPILAIVNLGTRVFVAIANGKLVVFRRQADGQWDLNNYFLVTLGSPKHSTRCLCIAADKIWAAHRNKIFVIDPISLNIVRKFEAHPRKESQIRQMTATGLGVWVSIRLDSTLRLYNALSYEHIQDVDIEPYVSKMLGTGKLGFSFVRITALLVSCNRLWIGTSNGVVISVPLNDGGISNNYKTSNTTATSNTTSNSNTNNINTIIKASNNSNNDGYIPRCCMANAQLSFHGHRDAVKFFVAVPMSQSNKNSLTQLNNDKKDMLVICGGEGYIDFRQGDNSMENSVHLEMNQNLENRGEKSFLIVWHVNQR